MWGMRLQVALVPPLAVQEDVAAVVESVPGGAGQLAAVPADLLHLRLVNFGNVTVRDAETLRNTLDKEMAQWPVMRFQFRGGTALEPIGDDSAWATLEGDVEQLADIANLTVRVVKRLGFLVDRRVPRTLVRLGRITPDTSEKYLQRLIDRLEGYSGPAWTCRGLALLSVSEHAPGIPEFEVVHRLRLKQEAGSDSTPG